VNLFEDTNPRALKDFLAEIHNRTTVLLDFQRGFVWEPGATASADLEADGKDLE
jgi:hypothetical protein